MGNDRIGDCTCAAAGHMIEQWSAYASTPVVPADAWVIAAYSAVSGYNPATGAHDNGAVLPDVLNYWRKNGVDGHAIQAYTALEPKNHVLFGNCSIGLGLPTSAQKQRVWAVPPGGAAGAGAPGSWGALKRMSWSFLDTYCDEAYAVLSTDWINKTKKIAPSHFDFQALEKDLGEIDKAAAAGAGSQAEGHGPVLQRLQVNRRKYIAANERK